MSEIKVIDEFGEVFPLANFSPEVLRQLDDQQAEDVAYISKIVKKYLNNPADELKRRLEEGNHQFNRVKLGTSTRQVMDADDEQLKKAFFKKYGWGALEVKSPSKLKKEFGTRIDEDVDSVSVITSTNRVQWL